MFNVSTDDYGAEIWFGGYGDGTITIEGAETVWFGGGMMQDQDQWKAAVKEARLLAAAPDMLAALEFALDTIEHREGLRHRVDLFTESERDKLRVAIAKAKGESE